MRMMITWPPSVAESLTEDWTWSTRKEGS